MNHYLVPRKCLKDYLNPIFESNTIYTIKKNTRFPYEYWRLVYDIYSGFRNIFNAYNNNNLVVSMQTMRT